MSAPFSAAHSSPISLLAKAGVSVLKFMTAALVGPGRKYQPEKHYMRGPGPKCREKQTLTRSGCDEIQMPHDLDGKWDF
ncbi:MAG: hypothetical protein K2X60_13645 [Xanthobacteraceae bacterium]|nr:hypothetical protein [Xanthobacteraceae bacterium]